MDVTYRGIMNSKNQKFNTISEKLRNLQLLGRINKSTLQKILFSLSEKVDFSSFELSGEDATLEIINDYQQMHDICLCHDDFNKQKEISEVDANLIIREKIKIINPLDYSITDRSKFVCNVMNIVDFDPITSEKTYSSEECDFYINKRILLEKTVRVGKKTSHIIILYLPI